MWLRGRCPWSLDGRLLNPPPQRPTGKKSRPIADIGFWHAAVATTATPDLARRQLLLGDISRALDAYHLVRVAYCRTPLGEETLDPALFPLARAVDELMMADRSDAELAVSLAPLREAIAQHQEEVVTAADALAAYQAGGEHQLDRLGPDAASYRAGAGDAREAWEAQSEEDLAAVTELILAFVARLDEKYGPKSKRNDRDFPTLWLCSKVDALEILRIVFVVWLHADEEILMACRDTHGSNWAATEAAVNAMASTTRTRKALESRYHKLKSEYDDDVSDEDDEEDDDDEITTEVHYCSRGYYDFYLNRPGTYFNILRPNVYRIYSDASRDNPNAPFAFRVLMDGVLICDVRHCALRRHHHQAAGKARLPRDRVHCVVRLLVPPRLQGPLLGRGILPVDLASRQADASLPPRPQSPAWSR